MPYGYVYLTTNSVNGRSYVGQKQCSKFKKWYLGSGKLLRQAVAKYGKAAFSVEPIGFYETRKELDQAEIDYIAILRAFGADLYNICNGGEGLGIGSDHPMWGKSPSESTRKKLREARSKWTFSALHIQHLSEAGKRRMAEHPLQFSPETRAKMSASSKNRVFSAHHRKHLSDSETGSKNHRYGKRQSEATNAKCRATWQAKQDAQIKEILLRYGLLVFAI